MLFFYRAIITYVSVLFITICDVCYLPLTILAAEQLQLAAILCLHFEHFLARLLVDLKVNDGNNKLLLL